MKLSTLTDYIKHLAVVAVIPVVGLSILASRSESVVNAQTPDVTNDISQERVPIQLPEELKNIAIQKVALSNNLSPSELDLINSTTSTYPLSGRTAFKFKLIDKRDGTIYEIALNRNGQELDPEQLTEDEQVARITKYGKLSSGLSELLEDAPAGEPIPVIIRLKGPPPSQPELPRPGSDVSIEQVDAILKQVDAQRATAVGAIVTPVADRLSQLGYDVGIDKYEPVLYARLTPEIIREVEKWDEVRLISIDRVNEPELEVARPTMGTDAVHSRGYTGSGVRAAQIEVEGRIATSNPYLQSDSSINSEVIQDTTYVCSSASSHSTAVAGIIRSTHSPRRGIAPTVSLWAGGSCDGRTSELQNRSTAASNWGAKVINLSWGSNIGLTPDGIDIFYDSFVFNRRRTIVKSAGNEAGNCQSQTGNVTSPGLGYSIITVGTFNDGNTTSWSDDAMWSCSSWRNPSSTNNDRQKPEIVAPGVNINSTTTSNPWTGDVRAGTS